MATSRVAEAIRDHAREQALRARNVHHALVVAIDEDREPTDLDLLDGPTLDEDDFDLSSSMSGYAVGVGFEVDDTVLLARESGHYTLFDVLSDNTPAKKVSEADLPGIAVDVQTFVTPGSFTWKKPTNALGMAAKLVEVYIMEAGGGGGAGRRGATGTVRAGGGGGGGGGHAFLRAPAGDLDATEAVVVGAGGAGAAGATNDDFNGGGGAPGNKTYFKSHAWSRTGDAGSAYAGSAGGGGSTTAGSAGSAGSASAGLTAGGGTAGGVGGLGGASGGGVGTNSTIYQGAMGGGGGGGVDAANAASAGGFGGRSYGEANPGGGAVGVAGTNAPISANVRSPGLGGGGGGGNGAAAAGAGGRGAFPGGGGGGGGGSLNGFSSGKGGDGAGGLVMVVTYF